MPFFSIISPVYNCAEFLERTIQSVLNQSFLDWELLLIDDGSKDESYVIAEEWSRIDSRIKHFFHDNRVNKGVSASRNLGLNNANGKYIAFLDSDDIWLPEKLERQYEIIKNNNEDLVFIYCKAKIINENSNIITQEIAPQFNKMKTIYGYGIPGISINPYRKIINKGFEAPTSSVVIKKSVIDKRNIRFKEHLTYSEDGLFWFEAIKNGNIYFIDEPLMLYRIHTSQWNARVTDELKISRRLTAYIEMLNDIDIKDRNYLFYLTINKGFRIIVRYFLNYKRFSIKKIVTYYNKVILTKPPIIYYILIIYVLLSEFLLSPIIYLKSRV